MIGKKMIDINNQKVYVHSYEISIWTLQDSFITVLKWADLEQKGQVENAKLTLDVDGTQELSFSIPMYLNLPKDNGEVEKQENPIWYNTENGNLMVSMRKIKVILNKKSEDERVYEFIITKINERHESGQLYCDIECEGLAFQELGKIGYKIDLSADDFYITYDNWFSDLEKHQNELEPRQTIQYWNELFLDPWPSLGESVDPNKWYYKIEMQWLEYGGSALSSNQVYEKEYVSQWGWKTGSSASRSFMPLETTSNKVKERAVNIKESNIYNITQEIAKTFEVFCKYEYGYDENYHIISRKIIYYNDFIDDMKPIDLTYPYQTEKISREMDGTDLITKLYVRSEDSDIDSNIINVKANKSREDYILNFDYLHLLNIITEEQYEEINNYEIKMHDFNIDLEKLGAQISIISNKINEKKSSLSFSEKAIISAQEQKQSALDHLRLYIPGNQSEDSTTEINDEIIEEDEGIEIEDDIEINDEEGITIDGFNSKLLILIQEENSSSYYVNLPFIGIIPDSIKLIEGNLDYSNPEDPLKYGTIIYNGNIEYDDFDNAIKITGLSKTKNNSVWLQCRYCPNNYWKKVYKYWTKTYKDENEKSKRLQTALNKLEQDLKDKKKSYDSTYLEKEECQKKFEKMMGPALREGYWQPENYLDYNDRYTLTNQTPTYWGRMTNSSIGYYWDMQILEDEEKTTVFDIGNETKQNLLIDLSSLNSEQVNFIKNNYEKLNFIYYDYTIAESNIDSNLTPDEKLRNTQHMIPLGAGCEFGFVRGEGADIKPALIITDSYKFSNEQLKFFQSNTNSTFKYNSKIGLNYGIDVGFDEVEIIDEEENVEDIEINESSMYLFGRYSNNNIEDLLLYPMYNPCYLRVMIPSSKLNTASDKLFLRLHDENFTISKILNEFEDYYITKNYEESYENNYITIKSQVLFKLGIFSPNLGNYSPKLDITYNLSKNDVAIYLDALQVAKENSQPRVSYSIDLNAFDVKLIYNVYKKLSKLVNINDTDLKFRNVQGYISRIELDLDHPWEDKIEIKNYKTKFEDLFSTIIAQTEAMKKNSGCYDFAFRAFDSTGGLTDSALKQTIKNNNLALSTYLASGFDTVEVVEEKLKDLFDQAGVILSGAGTALTSLRSANSNNASILAGFARGVQEGYDAGIDLISSDGTLTSVVHINKDDGIYIGANKGVVIYSGGAGTSDISVNLSGDKLLFGVSNVEPNGEATAVEMTSKQILLAAGKAISIADENKEDNFQITEDENELAGVQITSNYIGLAAGATGTEEDRTIISLTPKEIYLGAISKEKEKKNPTGAYVEISKTGIYLGSTADLYINTNNFKLQTNAEPEDEDDPIGGTIFAIGEDLQSINENTVCINGKFYTKEGKDVNTSDEIKDANISFLLNRNGAFINGTVCAPSGWFGANDGWIIGATGSKTQIKLIDENLIDIPDNCIKSANENVIFSPGNDKVVPFIIMGKKENNPDKKIIKSVFQYYNGELSIEGAIRATSFQLINNDNGTSTSESLESYVKNVAKNVIDSYITDTIIRYYGSRETPSEINLAMISETQWKAQINDAAIVNLEKPYYIYTRIETRYNSGTPSIEYKIQYVPKDGETGSAPYITAITPLYRLDTDEDFGSLTPENKKPTSKVTDEKTGPRQWSVSIPKYIEKVEKEQDDEEDKFYYYYTCTQYEYSNNSCDWSNVYKDLGLTNLYKYATEASLTAAEAANAIEPLAVNGISSGVWNKIDYGVILGNESTSKPMLIGSNSGITIAADIDNPSKGEAIALTKGGIALHGAEINLTTIQTIQEDIGSKTIIDKEITNIIKLGSNGIDLTSTVEAEGIDSSESSVHISGSEIDMQTGGNFNISADTGSISLGDYFTVDAEGNLKCKNITCEFINGKQYSSSTTEQTVTVYTTGYQIWFASPARQVANFNSALRGTLSFDINLETPIQSNTDIIMKLSFANSSSWVFVRYIDLTLTGTGEDNQNEQFTMSSVELQPNYTGYTDKAKIGQGFTAIFTKPNWLYPVKTIPKGKYHGVINLTFYNEYADSNGVPYTINCNTTFYPTQSYIQIV